MCQKTMLRYEELLIRRIDTDDTLLTISVLKAFQTGKSNVTIYYRGPMELILTFLNPSMVKKFKNDVSQFQNQGIHPYAVAKRTLDEEDSSEFIRIINENQTSIKSG